MSQPLPEKTSRFPYLIALILTILLVNSIRSMLEIHKSINRLDQAQFQLNSLKDENQKLQGDIAYAQTPEYLQKAAVDELNMAKPGETILVIEHERPKADNAPQAKTETPVAKPKPLELWSTFFNVQDVYFSWQNKHF